jgi:hypothetical protein
LSFDAETEHPGASVDHEVDREGEQQRTAAGEARRSVVARASSRCPLSSTHSRLPTMSALVVSMKESTPKRRARLDAGEDRHEAFEDVPRNGDENESEAVTENRRAVRC